MLSRGFDHGAVDYVTKPIRAKEVLARMSVHVQGARQARQARNALDAFGHATLVVRAADGKVVWKTPGPVKAAPWSPFIAGNDKKKGEPE